MVTDPPKAQVLLEVAWEVCNKVGGIYTVIRSKVPFIQQHYREYVLFGPMLERQAEFQESPVPAQWQAVLTGMRSAGISCKYGRWLIPGEPATILVDPKSLLPRVGELKFKLWERHHIDSLNAPWEFDEPLSFATAVGMVIEEYARKTEQSVVVQCHEWMAGFALLHLKDAHARVGTVFTTHATILGRTIAGNGNPLYDMLDTLNPTEWAYKYRIQEKHLTEVACAQSADVFTTVSDITALEAERLLGRKPDVVCYNGFFIEKFPTFEETSIRHYHARELLHDFIAYYFFPYYPFDLDKTFLFFASGRYEYENKGMDVCLEALARLNAKLKEEGSDKTVVMFFWVIMGRGGVRMDILENKNLYHELRSTVEWQSKPLLHKIILDLLSGSLPGENDLFTSRFIRSLHEDVHHVHRSGDPPLTTHELHNYSSDPIISACLRLGLHNRREDRVKVILYPGYLDGSDGLLNLQYYDVTVGTHLGIFPSSYEPWGYTPLESTVLGVPAITTDSAGFGRYVSTLNPSKGVVILRRYRQHRDQVVTQLAGELAAFLSYDHEERVQQGFAAKNIAATCDWRNFLKHYLAAHNLAVERAKLDT